MWNEGWDSLFHKGDWGKYPSEELVRFTMRLAKAAGDPGALSILEVGSGPGANLLMFAREGFKVTGIDGSPAANKIARERLNAEGLSADLVVGDIVTHSFPENTFDLVVDVECIYANSWDDSLSIMRNIRRWLKPGGHIFSQHFATGMTGEDTAVRDADHPNTILSCPDGPLRSDYGLYRVMDETEIPKLFEGFSGLSYDYIERSRGNRSHVIREWIITAQKPA